MFSMMPISQVEVTLSSGDPIVAGGLIFWAKDYTNFYCFCIDAKGAFKISHFVTDRWLTPVGWTESDAINKGVGASQQTPSGDKRPPGDRIYQ